jgi:predicted ArsR family transcriptional regulator
VAATSLERQIATIASLHDPVRRALYRYVTSRRRDVGRDEAARAVRISRALAAFHLDKLVGHGLLETSYRRLTGRRGPGAGRPAKLYRRSALELHVTLPARRYELAGRVLARALTAAPPTARRGLLRAARDAGRALVRNGEVGGPRRRNELSAVLRECGYAPAPARRDGEIRLHNCPFAALAAECQPLICEMNLALLRGVLAGLNARGVRAVFRPSGGGPSREPGSCCVLLRTR